MLSGEQVDEGPMDVVKMMKLLGPLEEELVRLMRKIGTKPSAAAGTPSPLPPPPSPWTAAPVAPFPVAPTAAPVAADICVP